VWLCADAKAKGRVRPGSARSSSDEAWIREFGLVKGDKNILETLTRMLNTTHMEAVSSLISQLKPGIGGLNPPLEFRIAGFDYMGFEGIQIHHTGSQHFITSTSVGGQVRVFDSLFRTPNAKVCKQLHNLYALPESAYVVVAWMPMQKQDGGVDCGLFASAVAIELARGVPATDIASATFDQSQMRKHMLQWLQRCSDPATRTLESFPKSSRAAERIQNDVTFFAVSADGLVTPNACASPDEARQQADAAIIARAERDSTAAKPSQRGRTSKPSTKKQAMAALDAAMDLGG
jgi:hypothetical protein